MMENTTHAIVFAQSIGRKQSQRDCLRDVRFIHKNLEAGTKKLHVETKLNDVSVLDNVFLAFESEFSSFLGLRL